MGLLRPDIGPDAAADRLGQVEPVVLFTVDEYLYRGKRFDVISRAAALAAKIPSLRKVVVCSYMKAGEADVSPIPNAVRWEDFSQPDTVRDIVFEQLPADHPVYIMFSSGTTGKPSAWCREPPECC